jgi:hypothetical protein
MQKAAEWYAKLGYAVFPLKGKIPLPGTNGVKDATKYCPTIPEGCNIGIACGKISELTVIDIDGSEGVESAKAYGITSSVVQKTGKGFHLFFDYCPELTNSVRRIPGIDVRNDNGYVVAAPSVHENGKQYQFVRGNPVGPLGSVPERYVEMLTQKTGTACRKSVDSIIDELTRGGRNNALTSLAGKLKNALTEDELFLILSLVNENFGDPPLSVSEVRKICRSILRYKS